MKTKHYDLEAQVNSHLHSIPADMRPEMGATRRRVQSVAYQARGWYQATDINGNVDLVAEDTIKGWLRGQ